MIKKKISKISIITQLLVSTIVVFSVMMLLSSFLIGRKQAELSKRLEERITESVSGVSGYEIFTLVIDEAQIKSMTEYRVFAAVVMVLSIAAGGAVFYLIILRSLKPLRTLTEKINELDINNLSEIKETMVIDKGSYEVIKLSSSFQSALNKIYEGYDKQKRFSINVAHELRTPLAVVLTRIDVYKRQNTNIPPETRKFINSLETSIIRLSKLVEDILFISREYNAGKEVVSVKEVIEEIVLDIEDKANQKNIRINITGADAKLVTDDVLLERAIFNLIDNAIKYTDENGLCEIEIEEDDLNVNILVKDSGQGISDDQKKFIFDMFYRVDESRSRESGGYGVGLALVKDVVGKMGGEASVSDNTPKGSIFKLSFRK